MLLEYGLFIATVSIDVRNNLIPRIVQLNIELCLDIAVCASFIVNIYRAGLRTLTNASSRSIKWP